MRNRCPASIPRARARALGRRPTAYRVLIALVATGGCKVADKQAASDAAGPADASSDGPVDSTAPSTTIDDGPGEFSASGLASFRFSSNDPRASFECRIDREVAEPCQSPYARSLADGPHSFSVRAVDPSGNGDDTPAERLWTIDTVAPDTTLTDGPPAADNSVMAQFTFRSGEQGAVFDCSLDNAGYLPCTSGTAFGPVGDGPHSFAVRARDRAGNVDPSPAVYAWIVDTRTPDTQILSGPTGAMGATSATFTFFSPDAGGGATFQCALDDAAFAACASPATYSNLGEDVHRFRVRVRDAVGNFDPSPAERSWTVDLTPPNTTIASGPSGTVPIASASFSFTSNEADASFSCSLDGAPFAACTSPASLTQLAQGAHTFAVRATDTAGHDDPSPASRSWTVDTVAPEIAITAGPASGATTGPRVVFTFTVSDGAEVCSLDGGAFAACTSPFAVNLPAGAHQFAVRATDAAGNAATMNRGFSVACAPPDAAGAAGQLHLDDPGQVVANAVPGGAPATLGDTDQPEPGDPSALAAARFGGGLTFSAFAGDHVVWPLALPAMPAITLELWARPASPAGARDVVVSGDGRIALRVAAASPTAVRFTFSVSDAEVTRSVTSANVSAGAWHHVLASWGGAQLRLWVDGAGTEIGGGSLAEPPALDSVRLGGSGAAAYDGALDEVWLAQTAITGAEAALSRYCPL